MGDDPELLAYVKSRVAAEHGLTEAQASRLRGATVGELRGDAAAMRDELGLAPVEPPGESAAQRDDRGRFAGPGPVDMNRIIRRASGRVA
jgi:hypothetical protein